MIIVFDDAANEDIRRIFEWIEQDSPAAARRMISRIERRVRQLMIPGLAHIGRSGLVVGTRELVVPPYLVVYKVDDDRKEIRVLSIVHGARSR